MCATWRCRTAQSMCGRPTASRSVSCGRRSRTPRIARRSPRSLRAGRRHPRTTGSRRPTRSTTRLSPPSPSNHGSAANRTGYANPVVDELYDKLTVTIDPAARVELHKALLQEVLGDAAIIPLYWQYNAVLALKGVHGIGGMMDNSNTWNVFTWTKD